MLLKTLVTIVIICMLSACSPSGKPREIGQQNLSLLQAQQQGANNAEIRLVGVRSPIKRGETCSLTIQGQEGAVYSVSATYLLKRNMTTAFEAKEAGAGGFITWTWYVDGGTAPGTYPITITGGGRTINTTYIVTE